MTDAQAEIAEQMARDDDFDRCPPKLVQAWRLSREQFRVMDELLMDTQHENRKALAKKACAEEGETTEATPDSQEGTADPQAETPADRPAEGTIERFLWNSCRGSVLLKIPGAFGSHSINELHRMVDASPHLERDPERRYQIRRKAVAVPTTTYRLAEIGQRIAANMAATDTTWLHLDVVCNHYPMLSPDNIREAVRLSPNLEYDAEAHIVSLEKGEPDD